MGFVSWGFAPLSDSSDVEPRHRAAEAGTGASRHVSHKVSHPLGESGGHSRPVSQATVCNSRMRSPAHSAPMGEGEPDATLDRAVWAAYGWPDDPPQTTDEAILERLLTLNGERACA